MVPVCPNAWECNSKQSSTTHHSFGPCHSCQAQRPHIGKDGTRFALCPPSNQSHRAAAAAGAQRAARAESSRQQQQAAARRQPSGPPADQLAAGICQVRPPICSYVGPGAIASSRDPSLWGSVISLCSNVHNRCAPLGITLLL